MSGYKIKNWKEFQHFKDRTPPWIKLYKSILDDPEWHSLDPKDAKHLVMLWLLASEDRSHEGRLPDLQNMAFRLRITEKTMINTLERLKHWITCGGIGVISERYQDDIPEKRRDREETEKKLRKIPKEFCVSEKMELWFTNEGLTFNLQHETDKFIDYWEENEKKRKNWELVWKNWMRTTQGDKPRLQIVDKGCSKCNDGVTNDGKWCDCERGKDQAG